MEHSSEQPVLLGTHASFVSPLPSLFGLVWQPPKFGSLDALKKGSAGGGDDDDEDKEKLYAGGVGRNGGGSGQVSQILQIHPHHNISSARSPNAATPCASLTCHPRLCI